LNRITGNEGGFSFLCDRDTVLSWKVILRKRQEVPMKWSDFLLLKAVAVMVILNLAVPWLV
jgi:hypothetical protein